MELTPKHAVLRLADNQPFIFLGGNGSDQSVLITEFEEVDFSVFGDRKISEVIEELNGSSLLSGQGFVGLLSYDDYAPFESTPKSRVFKIVKSITFRQGANSGVEYRNTSLEDFNRIATAKTNVPCADSPRFILQPKYSNEDYLAKVRQVKSDISSGRFYQLNLLRYFDVNFHGNQSSIVERFFEHSGSHGAIFALNDEKVYSFSPERFVRFSQSSKSTLNLETWPIKGTRPRSVDPEQDLAYSKDLSSSKKDQAELHMIVDLMRNDFRKISIPGTVEVADPGGIHSFTSVHHLVAKIKAEMNSDMRFDDFFKALMPAGSITGAPKIEVMKAIRELETSDRDWFMGSAFYLDENGSFDSSVLIRTLWEDTDGNLRYAAGSGLVIKSCPHDELQEIDTKCRVLT